MATTDAVAAVGLTLQALLADRVPNPTNNGNALPVTLGHPGPDRDPEGVIDDPRINLFLYRIEENCFLKNQDIPGLGHPSAYGHPPLSLNLHYLLTVFGSTMSGTFFDETPAHQLLGSAMHVLHDNAIINDSLVTTKAAGGPAHPRPSAPRRVRDDQGHAPPVRARGPLERLDGPRAVVSVVGRLRSQRRPDRGLATAPPSTTGPGATAGRPARRCGPSAATAHLLGRRATGR